MFLSRENLSNPGMAVMFKTRSWVYMGGDGVPPFLAGGVICLVINAQSIVEVLF